VREPFVFFLRKLRSRKNGEAVSFLKGNYNGYEYIQEHSFIPINNTESLSPILNYIHFESVPSGASTIKMIINMNDEEQFELQLVSNNDYQGSVRIEGKSIFCRLDILSRRISIWLVRVYNHSL